MGREGWIYGLAFVAVLIAGVALIGPRLMRRRTIDPATDPAPPPLAPAPAPPADAVWHEVRVRGPHGPLRAPLRLVQGADVRFFGDPEATTPELRVRPREDTVLFGAPRRRRPSSYGSATRMACRPRTSPYGSCPSTRARIWSRAPVERW
ncbi:MAG: hypothetical protein ACYTG6_07315 [Planctomycetota bacterium]|jgi:hypothetical protein